MHNPFYITYKFLKKNWKEIFLLSTIVGVVYFIIEKIFTLITQNPFDFSYFYSVFLLKINQAVIPTYTNGFIIGFWIKVGLLLLLVSFILSFFIRLLNIDIVETTGLNRNQYPGQPNYHLSFNSTDPIDCGLGTGLVSGYSTKFDHTKVSKYAQTRDRSLVLEGLFAATAYNNSQRAAQMRAKQVVTNKWLFRLSQLVPFTLATINKNFLPLWLKTFIVSAVFFVSSFIITLFYDGIVNQLLVGHSRFTIFFIVIVWILSLTLNGAILLPALSLSFFRQKYNPLDIFATGYHIFLKYKKAVSLFTIAIAVYVLFTHLIYNGVVSLANHLSLGLVGTILMYGLFMFKYFAVVAFALLTFHIYIRSGEQDAKSLDRKYNLFISAPDTRMMRLIMHKHMIAQSTTPYYQQDESIKRLRTDYTKFSVRNVQQCEQAQSYAEKDRKLQFDLNEFVMLNPAQYRKAEPFSLKHCLCNLFKRSNKPKLTKAERAQAKAQAKAQAQQAKAQSKADAIKVRTKGSMTASADNLKPNPNSSDNSAATTEQATDSAKTKSTAKSKPSIFTIRGLRQKVAKESFEKQAREFQTQARIDNNETDEADKL